jgi:hypothetical protein
VPAAPRGRGRDILRNGRRPRCAPSRRPGTRPIIPSFHCSNACAASPGSRRHGTNSRGEVGSSRSARAAVHCVEPSQRGTYSCRPAPARRRAPRGNAAPTPPAPIVHDCLEWSAVTRTRSQLHTPACRRARPEADARGRRHLRACASAGSAPRIDGNGRTQPGDGPIGPIHSILGRYRQACADARMSIGRRAGQGSDAAGLVCLPGNESDDEGPQLQ